MPNNTFQNTSEPLSHEQSLILTYEGEDDKFFHVIDPKRSFLAFPKNRSNPQPLFDLPPKPLTPAFHMLILAFVGLAPAGMGALVLAPLAVLWTLRVLITRHLSRDDIKRVFIIWGISLVLFILAIPMATLFLSSLSTLRTP